MLSRFNKISLRPFSSALIQTADRWHRNLVVDIDEQSAINHANNRRTTPIEVISKSNFKEWKSKQPQSTIQWLKATGNTNPAGASHFFVPFETELEGGSVVKVIFIAKDEISSDGDNGGLMSPYAFSSLASKLPPGRYAFDPPLPRTVSGNAALSWAFGTYKYQRYNAKKFEKLMDEKEFPLGPILVLPPSEKEEDTHDHGVPPTIPDVVQAAATATYLVRDMINTPAQDCGPERIEEYVQAIVSDAVVRGHGTISFKRTVGTELLKKPGYPMVYAVGKASPSERQPRVLEINWVPKLLNDDESQEIDLEDGVGMAVGTVAGIVTSALTSEVVGDAVNSVVSKVVSDIMHEMNEEEGKLEDQSDNASDKGTEPTITDIQLKEITRRVAIALEELKQAEVSQSEQEIIQKDENIEDNQVPKDENLSKKRKKSKSMNSSELPRVTLIGKGVTFDTGGLNLKPGDSMLHMKKDMGGAAQALGLALMVIRTGLKVRLRVLIPCAENSIGSRSFRPGDVLTARNGVTVEVGNTDAEGRLLLADALIDADNAEFAKRDEQSTLGHLASDLAVLLNDIIKDRRNDNSSEEEDDDAYQRGEDLIIDFATLTGAARVATGAEMGALFSNKPHLARELQDLSFESNVQDPLWAQPLLLNYKSQLSSNIANLKNIGEGSLGGHITAALFLHEFLRKPVLVKSSLEYSDNHSALLEKSSTNSTMRTDKPTTTIVNDDDEDGDADYYDYDDDEEDVIKKTSEQNQMNGTSDEMEEPPEPEFKIRPTTPWIHVDMAAYNTKARPGRPVGGDAQGMRAVYAFLAAKFPTTP